jgi:hypothetical protein
MRLAAFITFLTIGLIAAVIFAEADRIPTCFVDLNEEE